MERGRSMISTAGILWALFLLVGIAVRGVSGLAVTVTDMECVYEYVLYDGDTVSGNFVVVDHDIFWSSDHPGIDLIVTSPAGNTVHSTKGTSGDKFEFKAPRSGMYKFCFHNPHATPETVSFYIHVGHIPNEHDLAKDEHLDPVNVKIAELREALESVTAEQKYLRARDTRHRHKDPVVKKLLFMYGKCGSVHDAHKMFDGMSQRTIFTWNALIGAYASNARSLGDPWSSIRR
ncbi:Transmembrane emp24 domain-containing protein p24beta3 [Acorus calamus]|uniref:Transmembrane emp24 domain-containing protein p24beta3 n=1 Tax=Acorus calamus TaxID=4465 RepID=A0AAV9E8R6_ACOCL|nr:Transmembrane emp24 domain-containing protein p24beta3 [Acorus calamus]